MAKKPQREDLEFRVQVNSEADVPEDLRIDVKVAGGYIYIGRRKVARVGSTLRFEPDDGFKCGYHVSVV